MEPCPKCAYMRRPTDTTPEWQCPSCGIVYEKFGTVPRGHAHNFDFDLDKAAVQANSAAEVDWSEEFQQRRILTWRKSRFAFGLLAVGAAGPWIIPDGPMSIYGFLMFATFAVGIVWLTFVGKRYYTCPSCDRMPMSSTRSIGLDGVGYSSMVDLNPEFCSTCGVRLKPEIQSRLG